MKPIDVRIFAQLRDLESRGRPGLIDRLVRAFDEVSTANVEAVREAFKHRDAEALWRAAHKLRSAASAIGAVRVASRCGAIEEAGRAGRLEGVARPIRRLATDVSVSLAWLRLVAAAPAVSDRWPAVQRRA